MERASVRETPAATLPSELSKLNRRPRRCCCSRPDQTQTQRDLVGVTQRGQLAADTRQHLHGKRRRRLELELEGNEQLLLVDVPVRQHHAHLGIEEERDHVAEVELSGQPDGPCPVGSGTKSKNSEEWSER